MIWSVNLLLFLFFLCSTIPLFYNTCVLYFHIMLMLLCANWDLVYSTLEAQRAQIEYLTPSLKSKRYVCSTTDYEQCADVAITVPVGKTIQYTANLKFNNSPPRGVQVRSGTNLSNLNQVIGIQETTQDYADLSVTGLYTNTSSSPVILYIYVKSNSVTTGGNDVVTNVFSLN